MHARAVKSRGAFPCIAIVAAYIHHGFTRKLEYINMNVALTSVYRVSGIFLLIFRQGNN